MELINVFMLGVVLFVVGIIFGVFLNGGSTEPVVLHDACVENKLVVEASPVAIPLLWVWNYENPDVSEQAFGSCTLRRLDADSWKLNFKECG